MSAGGKAAAGASADYYAHRPDSEGGREYRPGFDAENEEMSKNEVYGRIEQGEGNYVYRIVLSPGEEMEAEELREWARDVMEPVEEVGGEWVGFVHDDHTEHPHAHVIAYTDEQLDRGDLNEMRQIGTEGAERWAEQKQELEQDPTQEQGVERREAQEQREASEAKESAQQEPVAKTSVNSSGKSAEEWARQVEHYANHAEYYSRYGAHLIEQEERITAEWSRRMESYAEYGAHLIEQGVQAEGGYPDTEIERDPMLDEIEAADAARTNEEIDRESEQPTIGIAQEPAEPPAEPLDDPIIEKPLNREREEEHGIG